MFSGLFRFDIRLLKKDIIAITILFELVLLNISSSLSRAFIYTKYLELIKMYSKKSELFLSPHMRSLHNYCKSS